jgi:hypothetical protein
VAGVLLTTVSAVVFMALVIAVVAGLFQNPYAGLVRICPVLRGDLDIQLIPRGLRYG